MAGVRPSGPAAVGGGDHPCAGVDLDVEAVDVVCALQPSRGQRAGLYSSRLQARIAAVQNRPAGHAALPHRGVHRTAQLHGEDLPLDFGHVVPQRLHHDDLLRVTGREGQRSARVRVVVLLPGVRGAVLGHVARGDRFLTRGTQRHGERGDRAFLDKARVRDRKRRQRGGGNRRSCRALRGFRRGIDGVQRVFTAADGEQQQCIHRDEKRGPPPAGIGVRRQAVSAGLACACDQSVHGPNCSARAARTGERAKPRVAPLQWDGTLFPGT